MSINTVCMHLYLLYALLHFRSQLFHLVYSRCLSFELLLYLKFACISHSTKPVIKFSTCIFIILDARDKRTKDGKKMFLIRMVLGESYLCTDTNPHKYRRPPCANTQCLKDDCREKSHGSFDSVIGQSGRLFREFVVYQPEQCYPEYIISYDRV